MFAALRSLPSASRLAHSICMGHEPNQGQQYLNNYRTLSTFIAFMLLLLLSLLLNYELLFLIELHLFHFQHREETKPTLFIILPSLPPK